MHVFVTGATGFVGTAIVKELLAAGHQVTGLARSAASVEKLTAAGVTPHEGSLNDLESLRRGAAASDAVIHAAFNHEDMAKNYKAACELDRNAIEALGQALVGSNRSLVVTSGSSCLQMGQIGTEDDETDPSFGADRILSEKVALSFASQGVCVSIIRLPPSVHGEGDFHGFIPSLISIAKTTGKSVFADDGNNRWPAVHLLDAARLFRYAAEKGIAGSIYHGTHDVGIPFREIAAAIGSHLGVPVVSLPLKEAQAHLTWIGFLATMDVPVSSELTRRRLGWDPQELGLIADMDQGWYFRV